MGKRMRRGGRSPSSAWYSGLLRRRIFEIGLGGSFDADTVAGHLRSRFPEYQRIKFQPFAVRVKETLDDLRRQSTAGSSNNSDDDDDEGGCSTSTSVDSVFKAKVDPEFDLTKSMLRDTYSKKSLLNSKSRKEKDTDMEIEVARDKLRRIETAEGSGVEIARAEQSRKGGSIGEVNREEGRTGPKFRDIGGMKGVTEELMMRVIVPLCQPELPNWLGFTPTSGILLHGPPGCGKTMLAHAIANEAGVPFYKISAPELVSGVYGASEENVRDLFKKAYRTAPSIIFIDEIDAIASKRENLQRETDRRIVTQLMTCMDEFHQTDGSSDANLNSETWERKPRYVLVIGATNRPDAMDQALRRPGRFDREIALGVPDENARVEILSMLLQNFRLDGHLNLFKIARSTPGFVGADLKILVDEAGHLALKRILYKRMDQVRDWLRQPWDAKEMESLRITMGDLEEAAKTVQPSLKREGFSSIPDVTWDDIGGHYSLRKEFDRHIIQRIKCPEKYKKLGVDLESGFLLYGPPGCGKTLIAKAVANEAGANFIHIKGPELLSKYVGDSESEVRKLFTRARTSSPCILFFDEVDAIMTKRGKEGGWVVERLLNQLLIELDGGDQRRGVYVIGATNRIEAIDPAVLRPGRFGKVIYVPLPGANERGLILKTLARKKPIAADVDFDILAQREEFKNFTGVDLANLMNEAAMAVLDDEQDITDEDMSSHPPCSIKTLHFEEALAKIKPSVSKKQRRYYDAISKKFEAP
ncbi:cell division control protein 48 homolog C-like [Typha angustifolia]|uniref:cell division control protein 48 homolog C-like n=1 Tax=Typha angustifolia TaxID=59011 RepID=UPI003C2C9F73